MTAPTSSSASPGSPGSGSGEPPLYSQAYLRYALGLLSLVYVVNFLDRQILAILLPSIKQELSLADWQLGVLSGTAFGIFYATLGIPIARLADRFSRKGVIAICLAMPAEKGNQLLAEAPGVTLPSLGAWSLGKVAEGL